MSLDKDPHSLSGGYKRRLALAIQLVRISHYEKLEVLVFRLCAFMWTCICPFVWQNIVDILGDHLSINIIFLFTQVQTPNLLILDEPLAGLGMKKLTAVIYFILFFGLVFFFPFVCFSLIGYYPLVGDSPTYVCLGHESAGLMEHE